MTAPLPLWAERLAVFDTETTGVDPASDRIVSATIAVLDGAGTVEERSDWLVDPGVPIPEAAARVHGITTEVANASGVRADVGVGQIVARLREVLDRGLPLVAYNSPFDLSLLRAEAQRHGAEWPPRLSPVLDPLVLDRRVDRFRRGKRTLQAACAHYGVTLDGAHDAGADAIAAGQVLQEIARRFTAELPDDLDAVHAAQIEWSAAWAADFEAYMRRTRDPSFRADGAWPLR